MRNGVTAGGERGAGHVGGGEERLEAGGYFGDFAGGGVCGGVGDGGVLVCVCGGVEERAKFRLAEVIPERGNNSMSPAMHIQIRDILIQKIEVVAIRINDSVGEGVDTE